MTHSFESRRRAAMDVLGAVALAACIGAPFALYFMGIL